VFVYRRYLDEVGLEGLPCPTCCLLLFFSLVGLSVGCRCFCCGRRCRSNLSTSYVQKQKKIKSGGHLLPPPLPSPSKGIDPINSWQALIGRLKFRLPGVRARSPLRPERPTHRGTAPGSHLVV
jgi:hypothetical protein